VSQITVAATAAGLHLRKGNERGRAKMLMRTFVHLTTESLVIAVALMLLALPFVLALSSPFIAGW
jgi:hypothetical protein